MIGEAVLANHGFMAISYLASVRERLSFAPDVSVVSAKPLKSASFAHNDGRRYEAGASGPKRLYAALLALAAAGSPCPSNREFCRLLGLGRGSNVTTLLGVLRRRGLIAVEWSTMRTGARRVVIAGHGIRTGWGGRGPEPDRADDEPSLAADDGVAMGAALGPHRRFEDVTRAEAHAIARRSPRGRPVPKRPHAASPMACPLADLRENPEFDWK